MKTRRQFWVHWRLQSIWIGRVLIYWVAALLYCCLAAAVSQYRQNPEWTFSQHASVWLSTIWPWLPSVALILPLVIYDVLRLSHQFVGPVVRMRNQVQKLVKNANCTPFLLRTDDYWQDLVEPMNDMQNYILSLQLELHKCHEALNEAGIDINRRKSKQICPTVANVQVVEELSTEAS